MARWRKEPRETGLRSIGAAPRGLELREGDDVVMRVAPIGGGWSQPLKGWTWYGVGRNGWFERRIFKTPEEAKIEADAIYRAWRKAVDSLDPESVHHKWP